MTPTTVAAPMRVQTYTVERVRQEIPATVTLDLRASDGSRMTFAPGQFNMLYVFGIGEVPISISGDPARPDPLVHTIRAVGPVSEALCNLRRGETVGVRGPYGTAWPVGETPGSDLLIATGGIGLAPLRPALYYALAHREQFGSVVLLYGARTPADLLYRHELEAWRGRFDLKVDVTVDRAERDWRGHVGTVTTLIPHANFDPARTVALVCGPEIMMHFTIQELLKTGMAAEQIYISMERNMKCAIGLCGHCQWGPRFVCQDGPVFRYSAIRDWFRKREI
ncbi:MAG TPA: FAD/NAD(P)-binding protein [Chloroflexia bacterium]|nr:FAD/NAD(P)-binding protein [Chloroflexia bacterium]